MATPQTSVNPHPTKRTYVDGNDGLMFFNWVRQMPNNGYLGEVTYGSYQKKPIQVFDPHPATTADVEKIWQYQAQDGSFLCSMKVTAGQTSITFFDRKKGNWPGITVDARFPQ